MNLQTVDPDRAAYNESSELGLYTVFSLMLDLAER